MLSQANMGGMYEMGIFYGERTTTCFPMPLALPFCLCTSSISLHRRAFVQPNADDCLEELYPPGSCGTFCNDHTYDCYLTEIQEACCDERGTNCRAESDVPNVSRATNSLAHRDRERLTP